MTIIAIFIGTSVGAMASAPVANKLLERQVTSLKTQQDSQNQNFGRPSANSQGGANLQGGTNFQGGMNIGGEQQSNSQISYIKTISASTDFKVVMQLVGLGLILTIISSCASVGFILRYEPLKILSNRN